MAAFVYSENGSTYVTLRAEQDEEISTDMALAWAALRIAGNLDHIADRTTEIAAALENMKRD